MSDNLELNQDCAAMLSGDQGPALQFAMQLVERAAIAMRARDLVPVTFAHIDACFYAGRAHVDFARFMLESGAKFRFPPGPIMAWSVLLMTTLVIRKPKWPAAPGN